jgi:hypothetical protein
VRRLGNEVPSPKIDECLILISHGRTPLLVTAVVGRQGRGDGGGDEGAAVVDRPDL